MIQTSEIQSSDTTLIEIMSLHPQEVSLLKLLRGKFRFGDITIKMRDGLPFRLVRIQEFEDLNP